MAKGYYVKMVAEEGVEKEVKAEIEKVKTRAAQVILLFDTGIGYLIFVWYFNLFFT